MRTWEGFTKVSSDLRYYLQCFLWPYTGYSGDIYPEQLLQVIPLIIQGGVL